MLSIQNPKSKIQNRHTSTICAISTPPGYSGIGIVRLSGPHSVAIAERLFRPSNGKPLSGQPGHTLILGRIFDADVLIDEALVSVMRSPRSYTAEDVVEVNCHGGIVAVRRTLELMLKAGARLAEPGEFTKRAFLNGRIDLAQAEAVADLIGAKTAAGMKAAANQLQGKLSERIVSLREKLAECLARLEATIDFPEDEVPELGAPGALAVVEETIHEIDALLSNAHGGKLYRDGVSTVIAGKPNVGKSSVLNAILNEPRAIVTEEPGTTRDVIVESLELRGIALRLSDTAGIREPGCEIERLGVERSERAIDDADLVLFVIDLTYPFSAEDNRIMERLASKTHVIVVANKADLDPHPDTSGIEKSFPGRRIIRTSATQGTGIKQLEDAIFKEVTEGAAIAPEEILVSRLRHQQALENARSALRSATRTIGNNLSPEFVAVDLREALDSLGEIVGAVLTDDILDRIFSEFCIGK
ncbi:tRNA uridine-5-carboxymethylaminomethyl(34) synthesis GTPase MnmE [Candidatus Poribacteria bacterium]|nr:tRNA uridine-5-carboxymethylaminomethyl(34) synthesis GTPase MnmE [Candidatus Poribacteria bacterium]